MAKTARIEQEIAALKQRLSESPLFESPEPYVTAAKQADIWKHGDLSGWLAQLDRLPPVDTATAKLDSARVRIIGAPREEATREIMQAFMPWRKGPFQIDDLLIDSEWRCDLKWARIAPHLTPLAGRQVLDVGGGNGYYAWRMRGADAQHVLNIDPTALFYCQFLAIDRLVNDRAVSMLPVTLEQLPREAIFDTTFSMGVLYHRADAIGHLKQLRETLRPGGELVLETLVVPGDEHTCLVPEGRYARMRNVWFLPSVSMLKTWLSRSGFHDIKTIDTTYTTTEEQRTTSWMNFESLKEALDAADAQHTIEGHPAPLRATLLATRTR
ncbi:MAG: tRNA 5-methoxyuridine(34)/uridine 5-oxyacetic acid(34) synthase CmoB [Woeseiaceae bacterium]